MNLAPDALTVFAVVMSGLHGIPVFWMIGGAVICIAAWGLILVEMRRDRQARRDPVD